MATTIQQPIQVFGTIVIAELDYSTVDLINLGCHPAKNTHPLFWLRDDRHNNSNSDFTGICTVELNTGELNTAGQLSPDSFYRELRALVEEILAHGGIFMGGTITLEQAVYPHEALAHWTVVRGGKSHNEIQYREMLCREKLRQEKLCQENLPQTCTRG